MRSMRTPTLLTLAVAFGLSGSLASPMVFAAAGKVLLVSGFAKAGSTGERTLQKGDEIVVGDIISTDAGARVQVLMADGARIVLQPASNVRIDEFAMPSSVTDPASAGDTSPGKSVATLLSGRVDASAGAIGTMTFRTHGDSVTLTRGNLASLDATGGLTAPPLPEDAEQPPQFGKSARSRLGRDINLLETQLPQLPQISTAISVPASTRAAFVASATERADTTDFSSSGSVLQFNSMLGSGTSTEQATYLSSTAALLDFGSNGSSGIRWGRWSTGSASVSTRESKEVVNLQDTSLHWIAGPAFEAQPVLPTSGSINFRLSGGTSPTDSLGHVGSLAAGTFAADFTAQKVTTQLSLDVNGYNWFASGSGTLTANSVRFSGTFGTVLIDGRVNGTGAFSGFLSAGPLTQDQLNGAGLSYSLTASQSSLGTVSGVAAFVPGSMIPLTPPLVVRDVAYAAGGLSRRGAGGVASDSRADLAVDVDGNAVRFRAPLLRVSSGTFAIGLARNVNTGMDAATGIHWGRWEGGAMDVTASPSAPQSHDLSSESLHWIAGNEFGAPPVLPQTGTATYTLVGNTDPTDTSGNTGVLGAASFNADFTARRVDSALTLNIDGREWYASGAATFALGAQRFTGTYDDVRIGNLARGQGTINGFFTQTRIASASADGAGVAFNLSDNAGELGVISGVLAYAKGGAGGTVAPQATQDRDIALVSPDPAGSGTFAMRADPGSYGLDANFGFIAMSLGATRYTIGSSTKVQSDVSPLLMLRWGRWAGGAATVTDLSGNTTTALDLSQRSLHWVEAADTAAAPTIPQFGSATYALMGATSPTDRAGHTGILNNASLNADFTHQTVSASFDVTVTNANVIANGNGVIGASAGLAAHQFTGSITSGAITGTGLTPQGSFSGFFSAPGSSPSAMPGGAGLTYTITDGHGGLTIDGAAAFRRP